MLHYTITGKGPQLVLLHGFCEDSRVWKEIAPVLSEKYTVVSIDLPGFGRSAVTLPDLGIWADKVWAVFEKEQISEACLLGHSMGGYVTLAFAEKYAGKLSGIGLFHSSAVADDEDKKQGREKNISFVKKNGIKPFVKQLVPGLFAPGASPEKVQQALAVAEDCAAEGIIAALEAMKNRPDRTTVLSGAAFPVLFLSGAKDALIPVERMSAQAAMTNVSQFSLLADSGHMGMLEEPVRSAEVIKDFLQLVFAH